MFYINKIKMSGLGVTCSKYWFKSCSYIIKLEFIKAIKLNSLKLLRT